MKKYVYVSDDAEDYMIIKTDNRVQVYLIEAGSDILLFDKLYQSADISDDDIKSDLYDCDKEYNQDLFEILYSQDWCWE